MAEEITEILEGGSLRLTIVLKDYAKAVVAPSATSSITLTVSDLATGEILNNVDELDIRASVVANGYVDLDAATAVLVSEDAVVETHEALVEFATAAGLSGADTAQFQVRRKR